MLCTDPGSDDDHLRLRSLPDVGRRFIPQRQVAPAGPARLCAVCADATATPLLGPASEWSLGWTWASIAAFAVPSFFADTLVRALRRWD